MSTFRTALILAVAMLLVLACAPAWASASTPPTLVSPANGASTFTEGGTMKFDWTGALQGDPDTLGRSFFRVEVIKSTSMPSGTQTEWPTVENSVQTEPGSTDTSASLGVPTAGTYKWRVCAWGVVDDLAANEIQQLPGGCSAARSFESKAAAAVEKNIQTLEMKENTQVAGGVRKVYVQSPSTATPTTVTPQPAAPISTGPVTETVTEEVAPAKFQPLQALDTGGGGNSALSLGAEVEGKRLKSDSASQRDGISGAILGALGATLPFVPIPFWTLLMLLACFPLARLWRSNVLGMFDWPDGSIDGRGGMDDVIDDLAYVPVAQVLQDASITADGTAPAPALTPSAPDRGRRAA